MMIDQFTKSFTQHRTSPIGVVLQRFVGKSNPSTWGRYVPFISTDSLVILYYCCSRPTGNMFYCYLGCSDLLIVLRPFLGHRVRWV